VPPNSRSSARDRRMEWRRQSVARPQKRASRCRRRTSTRRRASTCSAIRALRPAVTQTRFYSGNFLLPLHKRLRSTDRGLLRQPHHSRLSGSRASSVQQKRPRQNPKKSSKRPTLHLRKNLLRNQRPKRPHHLQASPDSPPRGSSAPSHASSSDDSRVGKAGEGACGPRARFDKPGTRATRS